MIDCGRVALGVEALEDPAIVVCLVLFFVSMGSLIDPFSALELGAAIILALVLVIAGKLSGGFLIGRPYVWEEQTYVEILEALPAEITSSSAATLG